jgi:hypothetical protein
MTLNPSPSTNFAPTAVPSNSSISIPTFTNIQPPPVPPPSFQQQQSTNVVSTGQFSSTVPPPIIPPFNFNVSNPQQHYFQPILPSAFTNSQQQQQQPPFQFHPNAVNAFPPSRYTPDNHGHSHEHDSTGYGHNH